MEIRPRPAEAASAPLPEAAEPPKRKNVLPLVIAAIFGVFVAAGLEFDSWNGPPDHRSPLNMGIESVPGGLRVRWNCADSVGRSRRGLLKIVDGGTSRVLALPPDQLPAGSLVYAANSGDVLFDMQVLIDGHVSAANAVRYISGPGQRAVSEARVPQPRPAPLPVAARKAPSETPAEPASPERRLIDGALPAPVLSASAGPPVQAGQASTLPLTGPPLAPTPVTRPADTPAPPSERAAVQTNPAGLSQFAGSIAPKLATSTEQLQKNSPVQPQLTGSVAPKLAASIQPPQKSQPVELQLAGPVAAKLNVSIEPPQPLRRVVPQLRGGGPLIFQSSTVAISVHVDERGRVVQARFVSAKPHTSEYVIGAALNAAKQWFFQPCKVHGQPVASDFTINFTFRASSQ